MSSLVQILVVFGVVLTGGGVALTLSAGGSGEGLSIFFLLGISAIFVLYAQGLLRWKRKHWHHTPPELPDNPDRPEGWATLEERYQDSPLLPSLRYFGTTLLRRSRNGQVELLRTCDAKQIIHAESPYVQEPSRLPGWLGTGQAVLVTLGLIGTFLGMTIGLFQAIPLLQGTTPDPDQAMNLLLGGARLAFTKSVAGMYWSIVWLFMYRDAEQHYQNAFADLGGAVDQAIPRVRTEALLLELGEERLGKLEAAVLGLGGRSAAEPRTVLSAAPSAAGGGVDLEPMLQLLRSIDSRLAERGDQRGLQALEAAADRLSLAGGRIGELGERLPAMLQARPPAAAPAPVTAPAAAPADLYHAAMIQEISRVTKEFQSAGEAFTRSLADANQATTSALHPLQELSRNLQSSSAAFQAQQEALEQLRTSLAAERAGLETLLKSCEGLTGGVQQQLHSHVEAMERSIRLLEGGYQSAQEQSLTNMSAWQRQLLDFLPELERRLQFPGYVKELEQALTLESESRKDLTDLLRRLGTAR